MNADLSVSRIDPVTLNQKLAIISAFMAKGLRVCIGDTDAEGRRKTTQSPAVANQSFTVTHTLGVVPDYFFAFSHAATGTQTVNATESEQKSWDARSITVHSAATSTAFTFLIASLK